jgi:hypothetical protein
MPKVNKKDSNADLSDTSELESIALKALKSVANDTSAPAAARAGAARTLLEMAGKIGRNQAPPPKHSGKAPHEMTASEIEAEIARLSALDGAADDDPF